MQQTINQARPLKAPNEVPALVTHRVTACAILNSLSRFTHLTSLWIVALQSWQSITRLDW